MPEPSRIVWVALEYHSLIVTIYAGFGFTVSETKVEIMCLPTKGMPDATAVFSIKASCQVYKHVSSYTSEGKSTTTLIFPSKPIGA